MKEYTMDELKKAVKACGTICGICNRELGDKYTMADITCSAQTIFWCTASNLQTPCKST